METWALALRSYSIATSCAVLEEADGVSYSRAYSSLALDVDDPFPANPSL